MLTHRSTERTPAERGRRFGLAHGDAVANTVGVYRRLLREAAGVGDAELRAAGTRAGAAIAARWPDLVEELEGMAAATGMAPEELLAVNARTELLAGGECSVVGVRDGTCLLAQNWDWHPDLAPSTVVWTVRQPSGRWFATLTEAAMLAKVGVSSSGLGTALNLLHCSLDGGLDGVPIHVLLRVLLDRCESHADALALLLGAPVSASSCIAIATESALAAVELSPAGAQVLEPDERGRLLHTNHFLAPPARGEDTEPRDSTIARLRELRQAANGVAALRSHAGAPESVCRHEQPDAPWAERRATLASIVIDPGRRSMRVADGAPCETPLVEVAR